MRTSTAAPQRGALKFVIVIPVMRHDERTHRCLQACAALDYAPKTICVVSDEPFALPDGVDAINIATNAGTLTSPAYKRDIVRRALPDADVYANLDDDAYPPPHWLHEAVRVLQEHAEAAGAGGPGLAPPDQTFWEQLSSAVLQSRLGSGPLRFRFWPDEARDCDDFPSHNLFVRARALDAAGGWATNWNGGEDTVVCARLADRGGMIRYDPRLGAYHYRRAFVPGHLWQIFNVGRSRGCFLRNGEQRSRKPLFAGPPALTLAAFALAISPLLGAPMLPCAGIAAFAFIAAASSAHDGPLDWRLRLLLPFALVAHHAAYTAGLLIGLATGTRTVRQDPVAIAEA
ncbi:MAG: glycosyltransferase family 2 protein [Candidatus Eremiobacteraeota bacterium]|nr:glycosyltransferase family 2 protein [Candidatus Eremiobacteraeota bacterium]MBV8281687.1 glycosyltransferase family 2 protein [Candidatus Eremiobacteraeota bacterium]